MLKMEAPDLLRQSVKMQAFSTVMAPDAALLTLSAAQGTPAVELMPNAGRVLKSSWIQRLKPRDEMEFSRGDAYEFASDRSLACPSSEIADIVTEASNLKIQPICDSARQIRQEIKDRVADRSSKGFAKPGFGPWINLSSATSLVKKPFGESERVEPNSVHVSVTSQPFEKFEDRSRTTTSHASPTLHSPMHKCSSSLNVAKPPLPPRSKLGLLPRPFNSQQSQCFTYLTGTTAPLPTDVAGIDKGAGLHNTFVQGAFVNVNTVQGMDAAIKCKFTDPSKGSEAAVKCQVTELSEEKEDRLDGMSWNANKRPWNSGRCILKHHGYISSSSLNKHSGIDTNELIAPHCSGATLRGNIVSTNCRNDMDGGPPFEVARPACTYIEKQMGFVGELYDGKSSGAVLQTASRDLTASKLQETAFETSQRTTTSDRADGALESAHSSSTTASFPWEMFVESTGASKKAREQFVEVYNEAREELKNQRGAQNFQKVSAKEVSRSRGHAPLRQVAYSGCDFRAQQLRQTLESSHSWSQGNAITPGTSLEHKTEFSRRISGALDDCVKQKQVMTMHNSASLTESKAKFSLDGHGHAQACDAGYEAEKFSENQQHDLPLPRNLLDTGNLNNISLPRAITALGKRPREISEEVGTSALHARLADMLHGANTTLGKRPHENTEEVATSAVYARVADKAFVTRHEKALHKPHVWLQRWHANIQMDKGTQGPEHVQPDGAGQRSDECCVGPRYGNFKADCFELSNKGDQSRSNQKRGGFPQVARDKRDVNMGGLGKVVPSAAAMAIVGTAARQFCATQPQQKGSFAFWSGFGMATSKSPQVMKNKGKGKIWPDTSERL